jgi:hypothetical protein
MLTRILIPTRMVWHPTLHLQTANTTMPTLRNTIAKTVSS